MFCKFLVHASNFVCYLRALPLSLRFFFHGFCFSFGQQCSLQEDLQEQRQQLSEQIKAARTRPRTTSPASAPQAARFKRTRTSQSGCVNITHAATGETFGLDVALGSASQTFHSSFVVRSIVLVLCFFCNSISCK
jgi:hypothetical protein